jgi:hypothetical protein
MMLLTSSLLMVLGDWALEAQGSAVACFCLVVSSSLVVGDWALGAQASA